MRLKIVDVPYQQIRYLGHLVVCFGTRLHFEVFRLRSIAIAHACHTKVLVVSLA